MHAIGAGNKVPAAVRRSFKKKPLCRTLELHCLPGGWYPMAFANSSIRNFTIPPADGSQRLSYRFANARRRDSIQPGVDILPANAF